MLVTTPTHKLTLNNVGQGNADTASGNESTYFLNASHVITSSLLV